LVQYWIDMQQRNSHKCICNGYLSRAHTGQWDIDVTIFQNISINRTLRMATANASAEKAVHRSTIFNTNAINSPPFGKKSPSVIIAKDVFSERGTLKNRFLAIITCACILLYKHTRQHSIWRFDAVILSCADTIVHNSRICYSVSVLTLAVRLFIGLLQWCVISVCVIYS